MTAKLAVLFPGQGSQYAGMGKTLIERFPVAAQVYRDADKALGFALSALIINGPEEELTKTEHTQPAIFTTSIAYFRVLQEKGLRPDFAAGHSLGEYSALVATGALDFAEACRLLQARGRFMQQAVHVGDGAMAALIGIERPAAQTLIDAVCSERAGVLAVAGVNSPGQIVISGDAALVGTAVEKASAFGARKAMLLKVSAPFHCPLMKPAEEQMTPLLKNAAWNTPEFPYVANVTAKTQTVKGAVAELLAAQICQPVLWQESMEHLWAQGVTRFIEVGPGNVLAGLTKRCVPKEAQIHPSDFTSGLAENLIIS